MGAKRLVVLSAAALLCLGGLVESSASAAGRYGPTGLGSNLHRRFVIKQAVKRTQQGRPVANRQIIWQSRPFTNRSIRTWRRW